MGACRVGRIAVRAASRAAVDDMASRLETALRLAAWPRSTPGAVILVRRLDLGALPADVSVHALTDLIGRRLADIRPLGVRPGDPEQPDAPVVAFAGRIEALAALAIQLVRHGAARAWYWRRLLPMTPAPPSLADLARRLLAEAAAPPHGIAGVAALVRLLMEGAALDRFVAALPPGAVSPSVGAAPPATSLPPARVAAGAEPSRQPASAAAPMSTMLPPARAPAASVWRRLPADWRAALSRQALPEADARLEWLAAMAVVATFGPGAVERLGVRPHDLVSLARSTTTRSRPAPPSQVPAKVPAVSRPALQPAALDQPPRHAPPDLRPEPAAAAPPASPWAGLWLLPAALARLGITEIASGHGTGLALACMQAVAARLGVPDDDPALVPLPRPLPHPSRGASFVAPAVWRKLAAPHALAPPALALCRAGGRRLLTDRAGRLPLAWTGERRDLRRLAGGLPVRRRPDCEVPAPDVAVRALYLSLVRDLRRAAGLSLRRLVRRPGTVAASATHVDVTFPGELIELRLRKAGLDLDPGWVPWLGRVVTYHYDVKEWRRP